MFKLDYLTLKFMDDTISAIIEIVDWLIYFRSWLCHLNLFTSSYNKEQVYRVDRYGLNIVQIATVQSRERKYAEGY